MVGRTRVSVTDYIAGHGDGGFFIAEADHEVGSPAHQLVSDPALRRLFSETAQLRWPKAGSAQNMRCGMPVRNGIAPKARSNLFHYDASILTMVVPIWVCCTDRWLCDACAFIEDDAANGATINDVASAVGVTPAQLTRGYLHYLGFTPSELRALRRHLAAMPTSRVGRRRCGAGRFLCRARR